ncbi:ABC transporter substrate-binding protein, partial [Castellaniella sp.]|uniref:ABC transporter substrate-binding protein n=1 Tax=Castellaniella sp. TaxID=1955812 RepID=UPI003565C2EC
MKSANRATGYVLTALSALAIGAAGTSPAMAQDTIKLGMSMPLSGAAAVWGIGSEWLCNQAAAEIAETGGVKVKDKTYQFECVTYDNKYNAADGAKVAQALINKDDIKFVAGSLGTAPVRALQSLTERKGVLLLTVAWGKSIKGPDYPLTFTGMNTIIEIAGPVTEYVSKQHDIKTVALLNPNDATGKESEEFVRQAWEAVGAKVVTSDFYERGNSEFQPVAAKL